MGAVIVGDETSEATVAAKKAVESLQKEAEDALEKLNNNAQEGLQYMVTQFSIADLRDATNTINNLMDGPSAAGTQRLQRLMIQAKYQLADDIAFPVSKKGAVQPRGEKRLARLKECLKEYIQDSTELLKFL